ncbi:hypothetical protein [Streptomyces sp. NPDC101206]|uniref:hypothetical protein n=1 Tax=Streptomyces sp. NPDC101206 TaxID=3366128 RepID=UPI00380E414A
MTSIPGCADAPLPDFSELSRDQASGRACLVCGEPLRGGGIYRGTVTGVYGSMMISASVRSCPPPEAGQ